MARKKPGFLVEQIPIMQKNISNFHSRETGFYNRDTPVSYGVDRSGTTWTKHPLARTAKKILSYR